MTRPVALVTGSTSGIGAAVAAKLAADGLRVVLHSRSAASAATGAALANELAGDYLRADLAEENARGQLVNQVLARYGRLDVLVNNAGISRVIPHDDLAAASPAVWRELLEVNLIAPWALITEALPALRASAAAGGPAAVVNVTSWAGVRPKGASIPYAASKAALNHVTQLLAATLAPRVRVNAVAPGLVDTPLTAGWTETRLRWSSEAPMRRAARPAEVAELVATLVHHRYLTGEVVVLDGGMHLR